MSYDTVYGRFEIDPIAQELLQTPEMRRLEHVSQSGYLPEKLRYKDFSRLEHSLGVYALLGSVGDSPEAQISGLLHDVSHTDFSHCTEYALPREDVTAMTMQDELHPDYIRRSSLPAVLEGHGLNTERIIHESNFPLLERNLPDLCADRLDYSLRGAFYAGYASLSNIYDILGDFNSNYLKQKEWVFNHAEAALAFASLFKAQNDNEWAGIDTAVMFYGTGEFLRRAFELGLAETTNLHRSDKELLTDITPHIQEDEQLAWYWAIMNHQVVGQIDETDYDVEIPLKSRAVNPLVLHKNVVRRLSEVPNYSYWADLVHRDMQPKTYRLSFG